MAKQTIRTDEQVSALVYILDSASTTGAPLTGLVAANMTAHSHAPGGVVGSITVTTLASPSAAWSNGGFIEVDATNMPGLYRFDFSGGAFEAGSKAGVIMLRAAGAVNTVAEFELLDMTEVASPPAINADWVEMLKWLYANSVNKVTSTDALQTLRNNADTSNVATAAQSDDGTTFTRNAWQ